MVNNAILLIHFIAGHRKRGLSAVAAAGQAARDRLRAIFISSSTTIAGLLQASGKIVQLRRNVYALAEPWRRVEPHPFVIANQLHAPSYVSLQSALSYEHRSSIITSNIPWEAWGEYLDDHLGATAIIDRLLHRSHVIVINGPSYREWAHRL